MRYDYYLFDFDGTICETGEGIRRSVAYSLEKMNREIPDVSVLNKFIGPPLHYGYMNFCGMTDEEAVKAVEYYRERYVETGLFESYIYPGMMDLLAELKARGAYVAIASGKPEMMLNILAKHYDLNKYLDTIAGITLDNKSADKQALIKRALPEGAKPERVCMVGDRCFDIDAAKALGMAGIGAGYGYGPEGELEASGADRVFNDVASMAEWLLGDDEA
ncbi:MAG: HAD hydrolase-like protein [Clostridia bacterium]|nr:HAD hydrolase-like protein [Clostridia bacterium]